MNILLAGNNTYAFGTKVFMISVLENRGIDKIDFYFMYNDLSVENKKDFQEIVNGYTGCSLQYIFIPDSMFEGVPLAAITNPQITVETYFRMAMSELLPEYIDRILYLDTDIIVNKSISDFYNQRLENDIVAVVCEDYGIIMADQLRKQVYQNLGFNETDKYFNAGVLLINMKVVRENYPFSVFSGFLTRYHDKLFFHDQDVLNVLFKHHVVYADYHIYDSRPFYYSYSKKSNKAIKNIAVIIHYGEKPWNSNFADLAGELFWKYAKIGGYENEFENWKQNNEKFLSNNRWQILLKRAKRNLKAMITAK